MVIMRDIRVAYEEARGLWSGCNWPTCYGSLGLDLEGVSSGQARQAAVRWRGMSEGEGAGDDLTADDEASLVEVALHLRVRGAAVCPGESPDGGMKVCGDRARHFCTEVLAREWDFAAGWLGEIESDARWAEGEAEEAVHAAEDGDWGRAVGHACRACSIESGYEDPRPWTRLKRVIENAAA
jgi:hypothetical protein